MFIITNRYSLEIKNITIAHSPMSHISLTLLFSLNFILFLFFQWKSRILPDIDMQCNKNDAIVGIYVFRVIFMFWWFLFSYNNSWPQYFICAYSNAWIRYGGFSRCKPLEFHTFKILNDFDNKDAMYFQLVHTKGKR